jgi:hypothetical protein
VTSRSRDSDESSRVEKQKKRVFIRFLENLFHLFLKEKVGSSTSYFFTGSCVVQRRDLNAQTNEHDPSSSSSLAVRIYNPVELEYNILFYVSKKGRLCVNWAPFLNKIKKKGIFHFFFLF